MAFCYRPCLNCVLKWCCTFDCCCQAWITGLPAVPDDPQKCCSHSLFATTLYQKGNYSVSNKSAQHDKGCAFSRFSSLVCQMPISHGIRSPCQICMPAGTFRSCVALVVTSDAVQVATEAHASMGLAGALTQDPATASPTSALAPAAALADPNISCPEPIMPAQAIIRVSATIRIPAANVCMVHLYIKCCLSQ